MDLSLLITGLGLGMGELVTVARQADSVLAPRFNAPKYRMAG